MHRFCEFVEGFIEITNKERQEKHNWEFFLHRIYDKSYDEFKKEIKVNQDNQNMSESQIEATVLYSNNILNNFNPEN